MSHHLNSLSNWHLYHQQETEVDIPPHCLPINLAGYGAPEGRCRQEESKDSLYPEREQLLVRLHPKSYHRFYLDSHGTRGRDDIPHHWKFPKGAFGSAYEPKEGDKPSDNPPNKWHFGPIAAFPSYGFDIQQGQSFSLSIPVKGVPVAMSILGAQAAKCSLTIKDAHTYAIDTLQIEKQVRDWAADNRGFLRSFRPKETRKWFIFTSKEQYYVRIVTRVYLAREFNVSVSTVDSGGLGLTAGLKMPANMAQPVADAKGKYDTSNRQSAGNRGQPLNYQFS